MTNDTKREIRLSTRAISESSAVLMGATLVLSAGFVGAQDVLKWWDAARLYQSKERPLNELKLRGRYQGQFHTLDSNHGQDEGWEDRRSRFGFDSKWFQKIPTRRSLHLGH